MTNDLRDSRRENELITGCHISIDTMRERMK